MRDIVRIHDCVRGGMATMDRIDDGGALNLPTGVLTSLVELGTAVAELCGYAPRVEGIPDRPSGGYAHAGNTQKQTNLGFTPAIMRKAGLRRALHRYERFGVGRDARTR
jgi:nucleoside-diphosphate-sugar epimerase